MEDDLFAMEDEQQEQLLRCVESMPAMLELRSEEDPALAGDARVLANILARQEPRGSEAAAAGEFEDYFETVQTEIKSHMRKIVSDWMLEVCEEQQCQPEVFHLAMNYMDRFLGRVRIQKNQFQLLGCVCLFLASKFKETCPLPAESLVIYTDNSVTTYEITQWELLVLDVLQWELSAVTAYSVLDQILRTFELAGGHTAGTKDVNFVDGNNDDNVPSPGGASLQMETVRKHAETFVALASTEHSFSRKSPAVVAVACFGSALRGLNAQGLDGILEHLYVTTGVETENIKKCMDQIEESICLSLSGTSFQPQQQQQHSNLVIPVTQKVINNNNSSCISSTNSSISNAAPQPPKNGCYTTAGSKGHMISSASTTPTDVMEISSCVY